MKDYSLYNQAQLNDALIQACTKGHLKIVKHLLASPELKMHADIDVYGGEPLTSACKEGHLKIVQYLLSSAELTQHSQIPCNHYHALTCASIYNQLKVLKYLLGFLGNDSAISQCTSGALVFACDSGHLDIVRFLLASDELSKHADVHWDNDKALRLACYAGHVEVVKYLLASPELIEHANVHADDDYVLRLSFEKKQGEVVQFLLYDMAMEVSPHTYELIVQPDQRTQLMHIVHKRDLFFKMNEQLSQSQMGASTPRLKI